MVKSKVVYLPPEMLGGYISKHKPVQLLFFDQDLLVRAQKLNPDLTPKKDHYVDFFLFSRVYYDLAISEIKGEKVVQEIACSCGKRVTLSID